MPVLITWLLHTAPVRQAALAWLSDYLRQSQGIVLHAGSLDYNLLSPWFLLERVSLSVPDGLPPLLTAERVRISFRFSQLIGGSLRAKLLEIERLRLDARVAKDGRSNFSRNQPKTAGRKPMRLPVDVLEIANLTLCYSDEQSGFLAQLPAGTVRGSVNPASGDQEIDYTLLERGKVTWRGREIPVTNLTLGFLLRDNARELKSMYLTGEGIEVHAGGTWRDQESQRLDVSAYADIEASLISPWLDVKEPLSGRVQASLSVSGSLDRLVAEGELQSDELKLGRFRWNSFAAEGRFESSTGMLEIRKLTANVYTGEIRANGKLSLSGQGESLVQAEAKRLDIRRIGVDLGWRAPPRGEASVQLTASCPGNRWRNAGLKAGIEIAIHPGAGVRPVPRITARLTGRLGEQLVHVGLGSASGYGASLHGFLDVRIQDQSMAGELNGSIGSLARTIRNLEGTLGKPADSLLPFPVDGSAALRAALSGSLRDPRASVELEAAGLSAGRISDAELRLKGEISSDRFLISEARLDWRGQTAAASGEVGFASDSSLLRIEAEMDQLSIAEALQGLKLDADVHGTARAKVTVAGTRSDPRMDVRMEAHAIEAYGEPLGDLAAEAEWKGRTLTLSRLKLEKPQQGTNGALEAQGSADFNSGEYQFNLSGENLQPVNLRLFRGVPVMGVLRLTADGKGNLDNPTISAEAEWKDLQVAHQKLGVLHGTMQLSDHRARLNVEDETLGVVAGADITTEGTFPVRFELTAGKFPYAFKTYGGRVVAITSAAVLQGEGSLRPAGVREASALLNEFQVEIGKERIRSEGPLQIRYAARRFYFRPAMLASGEIRLQASGDMPLDNEGEPGKISLKGDIDLKSAVSLLSSGDSIDARGKAILDAEIRGSLRGLDPSATLTLEGAYLHVAGLPEALGQLNATVKLGDRRITIEPLSARIGQGTIRGSADMALEFLTGESDTRETVSVRPARFSITADKVPLSLTARPEGLAGVISASIVGESPRPRVEAMTARLELTEASLRSGPFSMQQGEPATLTIADGQLRIDRWRWTGAQGELQLAGTIGLAGEHPLDVRVSGNADAAISSLLNPSILAKGSMRIDLRLLGSMADPLPSGFLEMDKGSIGIQQPRLVAEDLDFRIELQKDRLNVQKLEGLLNGGRIRGSGGASVLHGKLQTANIDLSGQDVFLEFPEGLRSSSNLRIQVRAGDSGIVIGGEVEIREGSYLEPFDFSRASSVDLTSKAKTDGSKAQLLGSRVHYNIRIRTLQPVEIDNNLARISARADVRLVGAPGSPGMLGILSLDRGGKVYFGGRVYYTERGTVTFANEARIDPVYDVVATTQVNDYQVSLRLSGTGSEIAATFTSDPPLSQNDVIALLLTGKPQSESSGSRVDPAQAERLSLLSGVLNADLSARMRRRFGISQVTIQPGLISGETDPGARLTVGQDLSQSLRFVYSMNLTNSADQIWYTEYDLRNRFTARATMQSDNTYRTDFQQDFRFGGQKAAVSEASSAAAPKLKVGKVEFAGSPEFEITRLAREFKIAPGDKFDFAKTRKGIERLQKFYAKRNHLAARIYLDREDKDELVNLTVQIEAGKEVKVEYAGAKVPKTVNKQVRKVWQEGISDRQRTEDAERMLRAHYVKHGFPQVNIAARIDEVPPDLKRVYFELQPGDRYKRVQTVFEGAAPEHAASITARIKQRKIADEASIRPERIIEDVASYYRQKGFYLARISLPRFEPDERRQLARIVFHVNEGQQIQVRSLDFRGNNALATPELKKDLPLKEGSVLDPDQLRKTTTAIAEKYGKNGYRNPEITPSIVLDETKASVDLSFAIKEGVRSVIQSVRVKGEDRVSKKYISRQLQLAEGKPHDIPETNRSIRNLYNTGAFARVDVESVPDKKAPAGDSGTEKVDVTVRVQEIAPFKLLYGGYYDSGRGPGVIAEIEKRNMWGAARVIGLRMRYDSDLQEGRLYFTQPLWRGRARPTTATIFYRNEDDYYEGLSAERIGFTLQQEVNLQKKFVASYGYRFENVDSWYPDHRAPDPPRAIVSPLTLSITRSTRNDFLDPTNGSFTSIALEYGPKFLGSSYGYTRLFGQYFKYFPLHKPGYVPFQEDVKKPRIVYATGMRVGWIKGLTADQVIPTERFYAGGGTTVRGFKQDTLGPLDEAGDPLGGNAMLVLNNELRFPMISIFDAVGFVDIGNVFPLITDFKFSELRKTAGFGFRLRTPSLMLRFDYGFKLDRRPGESLGAFFFSIGQAY